MIFAEKFNICQLKENKSHEFPFHVGSAIDVPTEISAREMFISGMRERESQGMGGLIERGGL